MRRVLNWDVALSEYATNLIGRPYLWGSWDCGTMVRGAYRAMYDGDLWPEIPYWNNANEALRIIARYGTVAQMLRARGATEWPVPQLAQEGDVLVLDGDHGPLEESVMLVLSAGMCVTAHPTDGIERSSLRAVVEGAGSSLVALNMPFELED